MANGNQITDEELQKIRALIALMGQGGGLGGNIPGFGQQQGLFGQPKVEPAGLNLPPQAAALAAPGGTGRVHFQGGLPFSGVDRAQELFNALSLVSKIRQAAAKGQKQPGEGNGST
jgi:hypothetical protein